MTGRQMLLAYCGHLRETAAGRASEEEGLDLIAERARLAKEQADRIALQNEVTRRELAPVHLIEQVLSQAGARVSGILEAIPGMLKRRLPSLSADDVELITREVAKARNIAAAVTLDDLGIEAPDEEEPA
ncbi:terminase small subunit [Cupriavidus necator]|uniref:terminase small subunit n=1 Tax=Cupriavidus necator TaxID=106590 RepID=UPI00068B8D9F|nr:terminase small subunit [Cupriavidus necator]